MIDREKKIGVLKRILTSGMVFILVTSMLSALLLTTDCSPSHSFDHQLNSIVKPQRFSILRWELANLFQSNKNPSASINDSAIVIRYFSLVQQESELQSEIAAVEGGKLKGDLPQLNGQLSTLESEKNNIQSTVQAVLTAQIEATLFQQKIYTAIGKIKFNLPAVNFELTEPPHMLAISPLDKITLEKSILLSQDISTQQIDNIESGVDALHVSSLVVELGGFGGAYPTFVTNTSDIRFTIETAIHEWLHQYLAFKPLGFFYLLDALGIRPDYDVATMNETVADIVSQELASSLLCHYYSNCEVAGRPVTPAPGFDFDQEMRNTRKTVDALLAQGKIDQAEQFMEQERQFLLTQGYYIRKLNQAYFAFNGIYADSPTSINPIGTEMKNLRTQSTSIADFLKKVERMTGTRELVASLK